MGLVALSSFSASSADPWREPGILTGILEGELPDRFASGGERIGVVKRSAVGTGPLRRSPAVHFRPIDLVVFQEPS